MANLSFRALWLCSLALAVGCSKKAPLAVEKGEASPTSAPQPTTASRNAQQVVEKVKAVEERSTPEAPVTEEDFRILDVVLLDLLDFEDFNFSSPTKIILDPRTAPASDFARNQFDYEVEAFKGHEEQDNCKELGDDLKRRNPKEPISLAGYKSPSPKILVENLIAPSSGEKKPEEGAIDYRFRIFSLPHASRFVIAWLPGYSKDGNTAVFSAFFGPTMHGATLTYKLAKKDGKWTVVWRYVARYM